MTRFGWPIGPLALIDEVGLTVARHAGETVAMAVGATPERNAVQLLADAGLVGKRGGEGFYTYAGKKRVPNPRVYELLGSSGRRPASAELAPLLTAVFVNEAVRCLDEGVLRSATEGDLGAVLGLGFPPFLGGPFRYADDYADVAGTSLADRLREYADIAGPRFAPAASIAAGKVFYP
jgi:3-hydroxyacyl-CoA dehydrogenase/enoyl-CoA hydratase/3-hydroxybutyryl-CoA epimerase